MKDSFANYGISIPYAIAIPKGAFFLLERNVVTKCPKHLVAIFISKFFKDNSFVRSHELSHAENGLFFNNYIIDTYIFNTFRNGKYIKNNELQLSMQKHFMEYHSDVNAMRTRQEILDALEFFSSNTKLINIMFSIEKNEEEHPNREKRLIIAILRALDFLKVNEFF
jgi:hypothetical protein